MANRVGCFVCRGVWTTADPWWIGWPVYRHLCPEHKRLRNRLQRRAAGEGDTRP